MTTSTSKVSYIDCYDALDRALASAKGIRLRFTDRGAAWSFRLKLNRARAINREDNAEIYDLGHPLHGRSEYDKFQIYLREGDEGEWFLLIIPVNNSMVIEEIEDD